MVYVHTGGHFDLLGRNIVIEKSSMRVQASMKRCIGCCSIALLLVIMSICLPGASTPRPFSRGPGIVHWDLETPGFPSDNIIPYKINPTRPAGMEILPAGTTQQQIINTVRNVFQAYENIPTSRLKFRFLGVDETAKFSEDGVILVTLDFTDPAVNCTSSNFKALKVGKRGEYELAGTGEKIIVARGYPIIDYDIALCDVPFALDGRVGVLDLGGLLAHELGHAFGLGHSIIQPTTMSGYSCIMGQTPQTLSYDERIGISCIYPTEEFLESTGTLDGRVIQVDEQGKVIGEVFGAHITVINAETGEAITESVTGVDSINPKTRKTITWDRSKNSGRFVVSGLEPGKYKIRVDAYDGPSRVSSTGKIINLGFFDGDSSGPRRDFAYLIDDTIYEVNRAEVTKVGVLRVGPFDDKFPNVDSKIVSFTSDGWKQPAVVLTASTTKVRIPKGINASPKDEFLIDGTKEVNLENPRWSEDGKFIIVDAVVTSNAPLGAHNVIVRNEHGFSLIHGGLLIASGPPSIKHVKSEWTSDRPIVTITGSNFTYDTNVYIDGLLASDIVVASPTQITAKPVEDARPPLTISILADTGHDELYIDSKTNNQDKISVEATIHHDDRK